MNEVAIGQEDWNLVRPVFGEYLKCLNEFMWRNSHHNNKFEIQISNICIFLNMATPH